MKRLIWCLIISAVLTWILTTISINHKSTEHQNVYYNVGQVYGLGQCTSNNQCSFQYTDQFGNKKSAISDKPVVLGQLVYQECWYEEAQGNQCYVDYQPVKN
jgi:hypothetical protein